MLAPSDHVPSLQVVMAMYSCRDDNQRKQINAFMTAFQEHPQAWSRVDTILEQTKCDQSKFFVSIPFMLASVALGWR